MPNSLEGRSLYFILPSHNWGVETEFKLERGRPAEFKISDNFVYANPSGNFQKSH